MSLNRSACEATIITMRSYFTGLPLVVVVIAAAVTIMIIIITSGQSNLT